MLDYSKKRTLMLKTGTIEDEDNNVKAKKETLG